MGVRRDPRPQARRSPGIRAIDPIRSSGAAEDGTMSQYLQRLATRNLNVAGAVTPMARSMSPIAEEDQRVGMQGFEDFQFGAATVTGGGLEDTSRTAGDLSGIAQRKINNPVGAGKSAPQNSTNAGPRMIGDTGPRVIGDEGSTAPAPADIRLSNLEIPERHFYERAPAYDERPDGLIDEVVGAPHSQATASGQSGGNRIAAGEITPPADPPAYGSASPRLTATSSYSFEGGAESDEIEASGSRLRRPSVASPQLLEPSPRTVTPHQQRESISPDDVTSSGETEPSPQVVIGSINVEVVSPPVEPKTSATSRPGPLTAESVSVIGPLSRGVRSNLRLSLRHR